MSRINTNVESLLAQRVLGQNNFALSQSLERLSTGLRINRGKDDPAGLIASENLRSEIRSLNAAIGNAERADQVVNIAEGGLQEISALLVELQGLVTSTASKAGVSQEEKEANQQQIDSILHTIDRIASSTSFQGTKLLNGGFDYQVSSIADGIADYRINSAKFEGDSMDVNVIVTQSAQQGGLYLSMGGTTLELDNDANSKFVIEVAGSLGSRELTFASGTSMDAIVQAINTYSEITGVQAEVVASGTSNGVKLSSTEFGKNEFVSVKVVNDGNIGPAQAGAYTLEANDFNAVDAGSRVAFGTLSNPMADYGLDLGATINGIAATGDGKTARINTDFLDVQLTLDTDTAQTLGGVGTGKSFTIAGGGADFQLGSRVDIAGKVSIGIADVAARKLGNSTVGYLKQLASGEDFNVVNGDLTSAQKVIEEAIGQVSSLRGRLGAFQKNTVGATIRSLGIAVENTAAAESVIRDADFASETAQMTRSQILVAASTNVLALANQSPQSVLQLLG